jgi:ABC-type nitrate/sulfonate/bicarbonate transport system ATPase subunit
MVKSSMKLECENLIKYFQKKVINNITATFVANEITVIIGPSGCGKSTLLKIISGLIKTDDGKIVLNGKLILKPTPKVGTIFQEHALFPWLTVFNNIAFGLKQQNKFDKRLVGKWITKIGLNGFENYYPHQISQGMCQRVAFARALICKPLVLLLDEPLGALDSFTRVKMQDEILELHRSSDTILIMVTHDIEEAVYLADKIIVLSSCPTNIKNEIKIELNHPRDRESIEFINYRRQILNCLHNFDDS